MYRVSKVLNNNGVIAINMEENIEYVLLGKGLALERRSVRGSKRQKDVRDILCGRIRSGAARRNWQKVSFRNIWKLPMRFL